MRSSGSSLLLLLLRVALVTTCLEARAQKARLKRDYPLCSEPASPLFEDLLLRRPRRTHRRLRVIRRVSPRRPYFAGSGEEPRRRADSNRCTRLCRPLPNHSATAPERRIVAVLPAP